MSLILLACLTIVRWQSDTALAKFEKAGGAAEWVDRVQGQLLIRRFGRIEHRLALSTMPKLLEVTTLTLHGHDFRDDDVRSISTWSHLQALHLIYCKEISDNGIKSLSTCTSLRSLTIWDVPITGECLAPLANLTRLHELDVQNCPVVDEHFASVKGWKRLRKLCLINSRISKDMTQQLVKALPGCEIDFE